MTFDWLEYQYIVTYAHWNIKLSLNLNENLQTTSRRPWKHHILSHLYGFYQTGPSKSNIIYSTPIPIASLIKILWIKPQQHNFSWCPHYLSQFTFRLFYIKLYIDEKHTHKFTKTYGFISSWMYDGENFLALFCHVNYFQISESFCFV